MSSRPPQFYVYRFFLHDFDILRAHFERWENSFVRGVAYFTEEEGRQLSEGFEIIEGQLYLRRVRDEDLKFFKLKEIAERELPKPGTFYLEWRCNNYNEIAQENSLISRVLAAITLFKMRQFRVGHQLLFRGEPSLKTNVEETASPNYYTVLLDEYEIPITEMPALIEYTREFVGIDFEKEKRLKKAIDLYDRMLNHTHYNDALFLALFQGFETLFPISKKTVDKGAVLAGRVITTLNKNGNEATECKRLIRDGYKVRNRVIHGSEHDSTNEDDLFASLFPIFFDSLKAKVNDVLLRNRK